MADVTEVLHRINYEVNSDALNNATQAIQLQIAELNKLTTSLQSYKTQMAALSRSEVAELERLSNKIDDVNRKISASAGKLEGALKQVGNGILKGLGIDGKIETAVEHLTSSIVEKFSKVEKLNFKSIAGLAGSLLSFSGVAPLAISFIADMAINLFNASKAATAADKAYVKFLETISSNNKSAKRSIDEQLGDAKLLINTAQSGGKGNRGAAQQLKSRYGSIYGQYTLEQIMNGQAGTANNNLLGQIENKEISNTFRKNRIEIQEQLRGEQAKEARALQNYEQAKKTHSSLAQYPENVKVQIQASQKSWENMERLRKEYEAVRSTRIVYQKLIQRAHNEEQKYASNAADLMFPETTDTTSNSGSGYSFSAYSGLRTRRTTPRSSASTREKRSDPIYLPTGSMQELPTTIDGTIQPVATGRMQREDEEKDKEKKAKLEEQRKENIKSAIDDYKALSEAAQKAYSEIIQAQIDALDKEISIREKRVEEAKKLAERGNVEALRLEEDRLRKAQEQRARFARQQQIVNSAIMVSNAIAAVARAALEGGGFGSVATIAALIAALAAGYAAVSGMANNSDAFADGVVDYRGKGGPRDDKNWVRISSGESIITAAGTQKNRALLEAINNGAALRMIDPTLPFIMPMLKQPGTISGNNYANAKDLKNLEGKLDEVVGAIEGNRLRQNIFFNEQGVGIMTERAIKKERKRWL